MVLTPDFPPAVGGIQRLVDGLVRHMPDIDARVVTLDTEGARDFDRCEPADIKRVGIADLPTGHRSGVALLNAAAVLDGMRFRPQAVLCAHIVTSPAAWMIGRALDVPFVQYLHLGEINARPRLARFAIRRAAAVVAVSRLTASLAQARGASASRIHLIPPGVDLPPARVPARCPRPLLVTVSRMHDRYKGHDVVIEALPRVRATLPDILWVVIGDGRQRPAYERRVEDLGLTRHVQFVGAVSDSERDAWLDRAHVFVMPSRSTSEGQGEGFGIVYLEAAAHGLPVVAGNMGGALDAVVDGQTGLLVDPTDPAAVAQGLLDLLLDDARAERMRRAAVARASGFGWAEVAARVQELLMQLAGR